MNKETFKRLDELRGSPGQFKAFLAERLIEAGIEPTEQYLAVFEYLYYDKTHPTVDEIFNGLNPYYPQLSRSRIYTILDMLSRGGVIKTIFLGRNNAHFDGNAVPHPHFICKECGTVIDAEPLPYIEAMAKLPRGAKVEYTVINYIGVCGRCCAQ